MHSYERRSPFCPRETHAVHLRIQRIYSAARGLGTGKECRQNKCGGMKDGVNEWRRFFCKFNICR